MAWERLAHVELSSAGDTLDTGTFTAKENLKVIMYRKRSGSVNSRIRFNGNITQSYAHRYTGGANSYGTDTQAINQTSIYSHAVTTNESYTTYYITNKDGEEKLIRIEEVNSGGTGAPERAEVVAKWTESEQITSIQMINTDTGSLVAGSYITVWGATSDVVTDEKTTLTNIEAGTQYRETDTRKIYRRKGGATVDYTAPYDDSNSWTQVGSWWSIDTTNEEADFTNGGTNASNRVYTTLDITLNDSKWICDFIFNAGNSLRTSRMVCLTNDTAYPTGGSNGIEFHIDTSGTTHIKSGGTLSSNAYTTSTNSTYYIRLMRTSSTNARLQVFSDSARTTQLGSTIDLSVSSSLTGIQYLQHASHTSGGSSSGGNWSVSNLKIYNNKTVSELDPSWVERGTA